MKFEKIDSIDDIITKSSKKPQIIFKHSTACPISRISYEKMKSEYSINENDATLYYVGVIEERPISNQIAEKLAVKHESPQVIIIKDGNAIFDESHLMINPKELEKYI